MNEKMLRFFVVLSEQKHFAKAANECNMSPSSASRTITRIEEQTGAVLVERDNRHVKLTDAGKQFLAYAKSTLANWHELTQGLHSQTTLPTGQLSLYCSVTASYSLLSSLLPPLRQHYPNIKINVHTGDQAVSIQRVLSGDDDLAIAALPTRLNHRLSFKLLTHSALRFIAPKMDGRVNTLIKPKKTAVNWPAVPFILSEYGLIRDKINDWFSQQQIKPDIYAQVCGHEAIVGLVALGFGVAVVPQLVLDNSPLKDKVLMLNIEPRLDPIDVGIVCLKKRLADPLVKAFWSIL